ncbi:ATP-dependent permease mdl1 [Babesia gibsoni]|uniref:ATP-dependent permease mdl1 n=1 Tax=Babesia gibsoni TaxID=33632 RepID=A0AAD8LPQ2_BABGI|nr:ATP-dependent permease mdl1 [Babesia gibsoni]
MSTMQSKLSTPSEGEIAKAPVVSVSKVVRRFINELEYEEKKCLLLGGGAMVVNAITNMLFPRIIGNIIDSGSSGRVFGSNIWSYHSVNTPPPLGEDLSDAVGCPFHLFKTLFCSALPLYVAGSVASWVRVYNMKYSIYLIQKRSRRKMFNKIMRQGAPFFHTKASSFLIAKLLNDCDEAPRSLVENVFTFMRCCNSVIGGTMNLICISPGLTGLSMMCMPVFGLFIIGYSALIKRGQREKKECMDETICKAGEVIDNIESVMNLGKETDEIYRFSELLDSCDAVSQTLCNSEGIFMGSVLAGFNLSTIIMLYCGAYKMKSGTISIGNLASFLLYGSMLGIGVSGLSKITSEVSMSSVSMQSIYDLHDLEDVKDEEKTLESVSGELEFDNVFFSYETRPDVPVLKGLSFKVEAGEIIAVVGPNGMGKSTTANLLTTLYKPKSGRVLLDGVDVNSLSSRWLRSKVFTVITQNPLLFSMSIEENLRYGNDDVTMEEIYEAAKLCDVHDFIESLPEKYDTNVGQRGDLLSSGQKQRIALARAVLRKTPCLIVDEAVSAMDGSSEDLVRKLLNTKLKGTTTVIITHHASTLRYASKVVVLNEGSVEFYGELADASAGSETFKNIFPGFRV